MSASSSGARLALLAWLVLACPAAAVEWRVFEGTARGFPVLRNSDGAKIADGDFAQWIVNDRLHVSIRYLAHTRRIDERSVFRQRPELIQEEWSLREVRNGKLYREFEVHVGSGTATAKKQAQGALETWSDKMDIEPGRTFAGFGFALAIKGLRARLS